MLGQKNATLDDEMSAGGGEFEKSKKKAATAEDLEATPFHPLWGHP